MASRLSAIAWLAGSWTVASAAGLWYGAFFDPLFWFLFLLSACLAR
jgi:hypothetical protein